MPGQHALGGDMARIRKVEIVNFRSIKEMSWRPSPGIKLPDQGRKISDDGAAG
jgi:hypothetical protein